MPERVTSEMFVGALVRRLRAAGGYAYVARRGNAEAGAVHIAVYRADQTVYDLYQPAPLPLSAVDAATSGRAFGSPRQIADDAELRAFIDSESRFDPDFWLVEIENLPEPVETFIAVIDDR